MRLNMYRSFGSANGRLYRRGKAYGTKREADNAAEALRKKGTNARVVPSNLKYGRPTEYTVWMQEPTGKWK